MSSFETGVMSTSGLDSDRMNKMGMFTDEFIETAEHDESCARASTNSLYEDSGIGYVECQLELDEALFGDTVRDEDARRAIERTVPKALRARFVNRDEYLVVFHVLAWSETDEVPEDFSLVGAGRYV
jgi:hypothetical protein